MRRGRGGGGTGSTSFCAGNVNSAMASASPLVKSGASWDASSPQTSHPVKSAGGKGVSFSSSVENYSYAMDPVSSSSEVNHGFENHRVDNLLPNDSGDSGDFNNKTNDLSTSNFLGYNYQSIVNMKVSVLHM